MKRHYSTEKNTQIVISLLKQHGIKKIIISPGATNINFVASVQQDSYFETYSSVDERSAAYMACGLSRESGEPVVLSCTGATSSRNYMPGLTEAYYSKLPIIAITSSQPTNRVGHHIAQVTDRSTPPIDTVKYSATLPVVNDDSDIWDCEIKINSALLETKRNGGGPVHLNLQTIYSCDYSVVELPTYRKIDRITVYDSMPVLPNGKVAIFIGAHSQMSDRLTLAIDTFCESNNAVVFCDHTSGYKGKYRVLLSLLAYQHGQKEIYRPDLLIHIGEISGDYPTLGMNIKSVWRVNLDGEIRDTFRALESVFEMSEEYFFNQYSSSTPKESTYFKACNDALTSVREKMPELPLSNIWVASKLAHLIPYNSTIHFAILNSLRAWNLFELPASVNSCSNVGGFGIDGCTSSLIGASLANSDRLYFLVTGDLAFFYDLNSVGNRHVPSRVRILLVNNGKGTEFRNAGHAAAEFGDDADLYMAAAGHYGNRSTTLIKHYAEDLGYEYLTASTKDEFNQVYEQFVSPVMTSKPMIFEVFTNNVDESDALLAVRSIIECKEDFSLRNSVKRVAKGVLGESGLGAVKAIIKR